MNAPHPREDAVRSSPLVGVFVAVLACALGLPTAARADETVVVDSCDTSAFWKSTGDGYNTVEIKVGTFGYKEGRSCIRFKFALLLPPCLQRSARPHQDGTKPPKTEQSCPGWVKIMPSDSNRPYCSAGMGFRGRVLRR